MEPAILYVDDERANLDLCRRSFDEDFRVLTATSGPAALEQIEAGGEIGVLVSDQRMEPACKRNERGGRRERASSCWLEVAGRASEEVFAAAAGLVRDGLVASCS